MNQHQENTWVAICVAAVCITIVVVLGSSVKGCQQASETRDAACIESCDGDPCCLGVCSGNPNIRDVCRASPNAEAREGS